MNNEEDNDLELIINYFLELENKTNTIGHIKNKQNLKYYSFPKDKEQIIELNKYINLNNTLVQINKILEEKVPKYDKVTYDQLIEFLFNSEKENFLKIDNKISYLMKFLNVNLSQLSQIKEKYVNIKKNLKLYSKRINSLLTFIEINSDKEKYEKFINK